jgi:hypothetical protein
MLVYEWATVRSLLDRSFASTHKHKSGVRGDIKVPRNALVGLGDGVHRDHLEIGGHFSQLDNLGLSFFAMATPRL